jgi:hypothetical protein
VSTSAILALVGSVVSNSSLAARVMATSIVTSRAAA